MGIMNCLCQPEDKRVTWNPAIPEEVAEAKAKFEQYLQDGYIACKIERGGTKGVHITEFDPGAEEIMMVQIIDGG